MTSQQIIEQKKTINALKNQVNKIDKQVLIRRYYIFKLRKLFRILRTKTKLIEPLKNHEKEFLSELAKEIGAIEVNTLNGLKLRFVSTFQTKQKNFKKLDYTPEEKGVLQ